MAHYKVKQNDTVVVLSGRSRGKTGRVVRVDHKSGRVTIEKVNLVKRAVKPTADRPGGIIEKEAPLCISKVALYDAEANKPIKVGFRVEDGVKVRFDKGTGKTLA